MTFTILLDKEEVAVGAPLTGSIEMTTGMELMQIQAMAMLVTFTGEEMTRVMDKKTKESSEENHELYSTTVQVRRVERKPHEKHYRAPFKIIIPPSLPPTIDIPWTHVGYRVGYVLLNSEEDTTDHETSVVVLSRQISFPIARPYHKKPFLELLKKNRFQQGNIVISARVDDTNLEPEERVGVSVAIRNVSPFKIKKVRMAIKQRVRARSGQNQRERDEILSSFEFKEYRNLKRKFWKNLFRKIDYEQEYLEMDKDLDKEENTGKLRIPKNAQMSYNGTLLGVQYFINLTIETTFEDNIDIDITPILVTRKHHPEENEGDEEIDQTNLGEDCKTENGLASENTEILKKSSGKLRTSKGEERAIEEMEQSIDTIGKGDLGLKERADTGSAVKPRKRRNNHDAEYETGKRKRKEKIIDSKTGKKSKDEDIMMVMDPINDDSMSRSYREKGEKKKRKKKKKRRKTKRIREHKGTDDSSGKVGKKDGTKKEVSIREVLDFFEELNSNDSGH